VGYYRDYFLLDPARRAAARSIAKRAVPSGQEVLDRAARAWSKEALSGSVVLVVVFFLFGLGGVLWFHEPAYMAAMFVASAASAFIAIFRGLRLRRLDRELAKAEGGRS
jgi:Flp pilus assembly protein TadB